MFANAQTLVMGPVCTENAVTACESRRGCAHAWHADFWGDARREADEPEQDQGGSSGKRRGRAGNCPKPYTAALFLRQSLEATTESPWSKMQRRLGSLHRR